MIKDQLNDIDKESIKAYVKGLSVAELEYLAGCLPVQICHNVVGHYIETSTVFENGIYEAVAKNYNSKT